MNSPHLTPALELDTALIEFSSKLLSKGLPTSVNSAEDLDAIIAAASVEVKDLEFWQFYVLDATKERSSVLDALKKGSTKAWDGPPLRESPSLK